MSEQLHVQISELRGGGPDIPYAPGVDHAALVAGDDNPVFLTLPLLEAGAVSRNGRRYDEAAARAVVDQINAHQPGGILGHMSATERSTRFDLPSLMWVGATLQDGKAYGKAYIPRYAENVREYVLKSKARRAKVATSIYGSAEMDGANVRNLQIESIDLADPTRAGIAAAVAEPVITSEMSTQEGDMPEQNELIAELRQTRQTIQEQLDTARTQISELQARVAELEPHAAVVTAIREVIPSGDIVQTIREMQTTVAEATKQQKQKLINDAITEALGDIAKNERGANIIRRQIGEMATPEAAKKRVQELLEDEDNQAMLRALVVEMGGAGAFVGGKGKDGGKRKIDDSPEALARAQAAWGFTS
jgi:hypothetical protein